MIIYLRFLKTPQAIFQPEILQKSGNLRYFGTKLFEFTVDWLIFLDILKSKRKTLRATAPCISELWVWIEVKRRTHILASIQYHYFGTDLLAPSFLSSPTRPRWRDSRRSWRTGCAGLRTTIGRTWVFLYIPMVVFCLIEHCERAHCEKNVKTKQKTVVFKKYHVNLTGVLGDGGGGGGGRRSLSI